jgi:hypothetical protein
MEKEPPERDGDAQAAHPLHEEPERCVDHVGTDVDDDAYGDREQ